MKKKLYLMLSIIAIMNTTQVFAQVDQCTFDKQKEINEGSGTRINPPAIPIHNPAHVPPEVPPGDFGDRIIFFLHGLGGDEFAWKPVENATRYGAPDYPARKAEVGNMTYTDGNITMNNCAMNVGSALHDKSLLLHQTKAEKSRNMIIAHSQGSIVGRTLNMLIEDVPDNQEFGGIAFFDGPQGGAEILRNARTVADGGTGLGAEVVANTCAAFLDAKIKATIEPLTGIKKFFTKKIFSGIDPAGLCQSDLGISLFQYFINGLAGQTQTDAYMPGAQHLANMQAYETSPSRKFKTHRVNFYSTEPDEGYLVWRTLNYILNPSVEHEAFQANADDGPGTLTYTSDSLLKDVFKVNLETAINKYTINNCHTWVNNILWGWSGCEDIVAEIRAWENLVEYFQTINDQWRVIIGEKKYYKTCKVTLYGEDDYMTQFCQEDIIFNDITDENVCGQKGQELYDDGGMSSCNLRLVGYSTGLEHNGAYEERTSDGVVLIESQMALPDGTIPAVHLINSSHMQVRNDENTRRSLRGLFEGTLNLSPDPTPEEIRSRDWFLTDKK